MDPCKKFVQALSSFSSIDNESSLQAVKNTLEAREEQLAPTHPLFV